MKEIDVFSVCFPNVIILFCFRNVEKIFGRNFNQKTTAKCKQTMCAETLEEYNSFKSEFFDLKKNNPKHLEYFENNWQSCVKQLTKFGRFY